MTAFRIVDQMENVNKLIYMELKRKMRKVNILQQLQKESVKRRSKLANLLPTRKTSKINYKITLLTILISQIPKLISQQCFRNKVKY